jgi:hypothetical protein
MKQFFLLLFMYSFFSVNCFSQIRPVQLHLQKNGKVKKRFEPGTSISVIDRSGNKFSGYAIFETDTIVLNGISVPLRSVRRFIITHNKPGHPINWTELGYVTLGVVISTVGMALAKWEPWQTAALNSVVLGYSPYLFQKIKRISFKKYKYKIGGRFRLRVWDLN